MERMIGWSTVAVIVTGTVLFLVLMQVTSCADAALGEATTSCTTEPMLGVPGTWIAAAVGAFALAACVTQVIRAWRSAKPNDS